MPQFPQLLGNKNPAFRVMLKGQYPSVYLILGVMIDMRKLSLLNMLALMLLLIIPLTAQAQEPACDIDIQSVVRTLIEAQTLAAQGKNADALAKIAEAQAALDTINTTCSGEAIPIELTQTFVAPDEVLTFEYPKGWVIGEYDTTTVEDTVGGDVIFASSASVFENIDRQPEEWVFDKGDVFAYVVVGTAMSVLRDAGVFDADAGISEETSLEELVSAFQSGLLKQNESFSVESAETFSLNDRKAGSFILNSANFSGLVVLVELEQGKFGVTLAIGAKDEAAQTSTYAKVIAASVR